MSASTIGDGASSSTFWCRRWIEHSRSPEPHHVAVLVGQNLHLDVAGIDDRLLDINFAVAERTLRLALRRFQRGTKFLAALAPGACPCRRRRPRLSASPDSRRLLGHFFASSGEAKPARSSGHKGNARFLHLLAGAGFRAHHFHGGGVGPMNLMSGIGARLRKLRVFREKAVAGMDGLGAGRVWRRRESCRCSDKIPRPRPGRWGKPRRPCGRAARRGPRRNRPRPWQCPFRGRRGSRAPRSPRDWQSGSS